MGHIFAGKLKPFKNKDILQMIGVYIIHSLALSLQLVQKIQSQEKQPTHGNVRIVSVIGPGWQHKPRLFRHFFACQDPLINPSPNTQCPNFKIYKLFWWLHNIWKEAGSWQKTSWLTSSRVRCEGSWSTRHAAASLRGWEMGYRLIALATMGTHGFFTFEMSPLIKSSLRRDIVLCTANCSTCFLICKRVFIATMDDLFNSVKLSCTAFCLKKLVLVHRVLRKSGWDCPLCVF